MHLYFFFYIVKLFKTYLRVSFWWNTKARFNSVSCSDNVFYIYLSIYLHRVLAEACKLLVACMWDLVFWPRIDPGPLLWECGVLAPGPAGKSLYNVFEVALNVLILQKIIWSIWKLWSIFIQWVHSEPTTDLRTWISHGCACPPRGDG